MSTSSANPDYLCDIENSTLLVVDIQTRLTSAMPVKVLARLQRNTGLLLKTAALLNIPVMATEQYPKGLGNTEPEILKLLPDYTRMYEKTSFSSTGAEGLLPDLEASGRKQVVLVGMEAHVCVMQTALEFLGRGYEVFVVADGVCSRQRESYETALIRMRRAGVVICDAESILFEWIKDAKHENFKAVQSLLT
jgi:nicotinamidase-related amidase